MKKDIHAHEKLRELGIAVHGIYNEDLSSPMVREILKSVGSAKKLDTRAVQRVWKRIQAETILCHATTEEIEELLLMSWQQGLKGESHGG